MTTNFLVVGGTGKTGRRVADRLRERGPGRDVRYVPVSAAAEYGVPKEEAGALTELFARVLGRPATDIAGFPRDAAATGVWAR
jgi:nucleoside-diphosphate-sugar epimerase